MITLFSAFEAVAMLFLAFLAVTLVLRVLFDQDDDQ